MFLEELGVKESGLDRLVKASYTLLGLISYLTSGEDECRAWTIRRGTKAPQAAGKIHSDFERGFIRAEVVSYDDLMACGSMAAAREKGLIAPRVRTMWSRTGILFSSGSMYEQGRSPWTDAGHAPEWGTKLQRREPLDRKEKNVWITLPNP